jgi:hypothetical protein
MSTSAPDVLGAAILATLRHNFRSYKSLADRSLAQLSAAEWLHRPAPGSNSAAVIVRHVAGNLRSRFTDFLTTDGEKPWRQRDLEFAEPNSVAEIPALQADWDAAWPILFSLLEELQPADLLKTVAIRHEPHTVLAALERQATHYAYHAGQIVQLAKIIRAGNFQPLSIPPGQSEQFNQQMQMKSYNLPG